MSAAMRRLLHSAIFIFGMALFGLGVNVMSTSGATQDPSQLAAQPIPPEPPSTTTVLVEETVPTTPTTLPVKRVVAQRTGISTSTTTTTVDTPSVPERVLAVARGEVGKTGPFAEGGYWCAKFVSWVAEEAKVEGFEASDSAARLHKIAMDAGRIVAAPFPGHLVFIDLTGQNFANKYVSHVGIVESVNGDEFVSIEGNADDSGLVTRQTRKVGDGYVIAFASFDSVNKEGQ